MNKNFLKIGVLSMQNIDKIYIAYFEIFQLF